MTIDLLLEDCARLWRFSASFSKCSCVFGLQVRYTIDLVGRKVMIAEGAVMDNGESTTAVMAQAAANATAHEIPQAR